MRLDFVLRLRGCTLVVPWSSRLLTPVQGSANSFVRKSVVVRTIAHVTTSFKSAMLLLQHSPPMAMLRSSGYAEATFSSTHTVTLYPAHSQVKALFQKLEVDAKIIELDEVVEGDDVQVNLAEPGPGSFACSARLTREAGLLSQGQTGRDAQPVTR